MICGIAGQPSLLPETQASQRGPLLTQAWRYRGPDGQVTWLADEGRVPLLHPRQAILDLSLAGHQPMEWEGKSAPGSDRSSVATDPSAAGDELEQATANRRPKTDDRRQATGDSRQPTADRRPKTEDRRPTTDDRRPTTDVRRPTSGNCGRNGKRRGWSAARGRIPNLLNPPPQDPSRPPQGALSQTQSPSVTAIKQGSSLAPGLTSQDGGLIFVIQK